MIVKERLYTIDDVWQLKQQADSAPTRYYLIDGELFAMSPTGGSHFFVLSNIIYHLQAYVRQPGLGLVSFEGDFFPSGKRNTLLGPDIAFISKARLPNLFPVTFV